jgi:REP element-mobilizing transposase RayT
MPNHVHGIIYINADFYNKILGNNQNNNVGNSRDCSLQLIQTNPKIKPLPELIGAYKTKVSKRIHLRGDNKFKWQKSYHDHIIRNQQSLDRIITYIETNVDKW